MSRPSFRPVALRRVGVVLLLTAAGSAAQENNAAPLTLTEALARAAVLNPILVAHSFEERVADALIEQAGLRPNPTVGIEAENFIGIGALQGVRGLETTVQASQAFERGAKREKRIAFATREREAAASEFAVRRAEILATTAAAYIETLAAQQRLSLATETLRVSREIAASTGDRVKAGAASPVESARSRAALASATGERARAQAELNAARARLAATWGGGPADAVSVLGSLQVPDELPAENRFREKLAAHPRFALQQARVAGRRSALELEQAQATPDVTVGGGVRFRRDGSDAGFVAGVSMPIPVRNKNQGNIRAARETLAGAEQSGRAIEAELRATFTGTWQELSAAHATVQTLRRDVLPAAEEAHVVVRRAYEEGHLPLIDVFDAQRALVQLRRELLNAEAGYAAAHVRLEALGDSAFPATVMLLSSK
jgi:outer membrane protein, heavy metal efflux system